MILVSLQVILGIESWMVKFAGVVLPELQKPTPGQAAVRVAHVLVGSFILATSVVMTILVHRPVSSSATQPASLPDVAAPARFLPDARMHEISRGMVHHLEGTA
jgi:hypothetical protein